MNENKTVKYMRAKQLAQHLGIGLSTVWLYAKEGKITPKKASDRVTLFDVAEVEKALIGYWLNNMNQTTIKDDRDEDIHNKSKTIEILEKKIAKYESIISNQKKVIEMLSLNQELENA